MSFERWQQEVMNISVPDDEIQGIVNYYFCDHNIIGRRFRSSSPGEMSFADIDTRTIYIPEWIQKWPDKGAFQWVVLHECAHIIYEHKEIGNITNELCADKFAARMQGTTEFGIKALGIFRNYEIINRRGFSPYYSLEEIQERIDALKSLAL